MPSTLRRWALWCWVLGAVGLGLVQASRIVRFRSRLRDAVPAPAWLVEEAEAIGARLGVRTPEVLAVPDLGTPMLWCLGRPKLLLPCHLIKSLEASPVAGHPRPRAGPPPPRRPLGRPAGAGRGAGLVVEPALLAGPPPARRRGRARLRRLGGLGPARRPPDLCRSPVPDLFRVFPGRLAGPRPGGRRIGPLLREEIDHDLA